MGKFDSRVKMKHEFIYFDTDIFKNGEKFENFGVDELMIRKHEGVTDAMVMCWNHDHKKNFEKHCKSFNVAVQAGGFNGLYPKLLGQMFAVVYTFEPDALNFHCVVNNCQEENIIKFNAALGDEHVMIHMEGVAEDNPGMGRAVIGGFVPQLRIDDLNLPACDLIQLDIEGHELKALKGAANTIEKFKPVICLEIAHGSDTELLKYLSQFGYNETELLWYASDKLYTTQPKGV